MIALSLTYGATTISLADDGVTLLAFAVRAPIGDEESVAESAEALITGSTPALAQTKLQSIENALRLARERNERQAGDRVYINAQSEADGSAWRSEIIDGRAEPKDSALDFSGIGGGMIEAVIAWERMPFWEAGSETQIPLTNGNGTNNTAGLNVYNCSDGVGTSPNKRHNYVEIGAGAVLGNLPVPLRLEMTNNFNSAARLYTLWMGHNAFSDPANFQHILEGEAVSYGGTTGSNAAYSAGAYRTFTWAGDSQAIIARWLLDTTFLNRAAGRWFKVLAAFTGFPADASYRLQCKVTFPAGTPLTVVASSQEVLLDANNKLQDIGTLQIPPWLPDDSSLAPIDLSLYARHPGGGAIAIDYLQMTALESFRILEPRGYGAAYQVRIVDDGITDVLYTDGWSPAGKTGHYTSVGEPILLQPGRTQRIYILQKGNTGDIDITRVLSVKAYYRPRRATI